MKNLLTLSLVFCLVCTSTIAQTAYITNAYDNNVTVINTADNTVTATIPVGEGPYGVAISPDGLKVYVTNPPSGNVSVINTADNTVAATIDVGIWPTGIAVSPDGAKVYVANSDGGDISVIHTADNMVTATIPAGTHPIALVVSPDGSKLYVSNTISNNIMVFNTADYLLTASIPAQNPGGITISPDGSKVFAINYGTKQVLVINTATNTVTAYIPIGNIPQGIAVSPDGSRVFATNSQSGTVTVINTANNSVAATINSGAWPIGIAISPDGSNAYVSNSSSDNISVINTATNTVTATIAVGDSPISFGNFISSYPVVFSGTLLQFCSNDGQQTGLGGGLPSGGIYSGPGVTDDGNGTTFSFDPEAAGPGLHILSYTINGIPAKKGIKVLEAPAVSLTLPGPLTLNDAPVALTGGIPAGGIYSGNGVSGSTFDPMLAGLGTHTISYTYADANGCADIASAGITVNNPPPPDNSCSGANDINSLFGQPFNTPQVSGLWDNTGYTSADDPATGYECFEDESLQQTIWFSFTGDGNTYSIRTVQCNATNYIDDGETQVVVYSGDCSNPATVACNENENTADGLWNVYLELQTDIGVNYLMMIDGFSEPGFNAEGEFCLEITNLSPDATTDIRDWPVRIFPNPTDGKLWLDGVQASRVDVYDSLGRVVARFEPPSDPDISPLPAGVYFLQVEMENGAQFSARVVKN